MADQWTVQDALRALLRYDLYLSIKDATTVVDDSGTVHRVRVAPRPSALRRELESLGGRERVLVMAGKPTSGLTELAHSDPRLILSTPTLTVIECRDHVMAPARLSLPRASRGPKPYARFAVARALLSSREPMTQTEVAARAGVTQQAVSHALERLADLVVRTSTGWAPQDRETLLRWAVESYPGAGGLTSYWWSPETLTHQTKSVVALRSDALISGDLAADEIAAWRKPEHAVLYARSAPSLTALPFAMADESSYTLAVTIPTDPTLWATSIAFGRPRLADPIIAAADVLRTATTGDEEEAVEKLLAGILAS